MRAPPRPGREQPHRKQPQQHYNEEAYAADYYRAPQTSRLDYFAERDQNGYEQEYAASSKPAARQNAFAFKRGKRYSPPRLA